MLTLLTTWSTDKTAIYISPDEVHKAIINMKVNGAPGNDNVPMRFYKIFVNSVKFLLANLFNHINNCCTYSTIWKYSIIIPIPKGKDYSSVTNYRPISLLPIVSKIYEKVMYEKLIILVRDKLNNCQHGFRNKRSTITQMILFLDTLYHNLDSSNKTYAFYSDFSKAFDSIQHAIIINKLKIDFALSNFWTTILSSYLTNRFHSVKIDNNVSDYLPMHSGVPQGSILGPLIFILYINDLPNISSLGQCYLYADDAKFIINKNYDSERTQLEINILFNWCNLNHLHFNVPKCCFIPFGYRKTNDYNNFTIYIGDQIVSVSNKHKDLGIWITDNLKWSEHVNNRITIASRIYSLIRRNCFASMGRLLRHYIWNQYIKPSLAYGLQVTTPNISELTTLEKFQKRTIRWITSNYEDTYEEILITNSYLPFSYYIIWSKMILLCNIVNNKYDINWKNYISFNSNDNINVALCRRNLFNVKHLSKFKSRNNFWFQTTHIANYLPKTLDWNNYAVFRMDLLHFLQKRTKSFYQFNDTCTWHIQCACSNCRGFVKF